MFSLPEAAVRLNVRLEFPQLPAVASGASIDSRTLQEGDLFIALPGTRADGHRFLEQAFTRKACGAVIRRDVFQRDPARFSSPLFRNLLPVDDPAAALADAAVWHRLKSSVQCVGITGSVGKTSTKEFFFYLLSQVVPAKDILATKGNLNNHLGLPLTLLHLKKHHRFCISEMGASRPGDIAFLRDILRPNAGILTKIAPAHLEGFGSLEAVYETKLALLENLCSRDVAVIPAGDPMLEAKVKDFPVKLLRTGDEPGCDYKVDGVEVRGGNVHFRVNDRYVFSFPGTAGFFARNAVAALAMMEALGFSLKDLPSRWENLVLPSGRFTLKRLPGGIDMIDDGYNASPGSFDAALDSFYAMPRKGRKLLVFSDMLELGDRAISLHRTLGETMAQKGFDGIFAYGDLAKEAVNAAQERGAGALCSHYASAEDLADFLEGFLRASDCVLFKASRGMRIERVWERLQKSPRLSDRSS